MKLLEIAKEVFQTQAYELLNVKNRLDNQFEKAIEAIHKSNSKVIVSGMGKSGIIGKKIAATLASTGTPSFFLHPAEAYHGDLGMIEKKDITLLISNSGETDEILKIIPFLKNQKNIIISMTGKSDSTLARNSDYHLNIRIEKEACPLSLAPTSSTTAALVMGDALAVGLMKLNNFTEVNFANFHPGGSLGRKLLLKVEDVMRSENLPFINQESYTPEIIQTISEGKLGLALVTNQRNNIVGIISDGDIRRAMKNHQSNFFSLRAHELMTCNPKTIQWNESLQEASKLMTINKINSLLVYKETDMIGVAQLYDL